MRRRGIVPLSGVLLLLSSQAAIANPGWGRVNCGPPSTRTQRLAPLARGMGEASGLVASWQRKGVGWMIRDSGKPASLYALRITDGRPVVREIKVLGAENTDWEDITYSIGPDGRGRLWIVESTQSRRERDPFIYEVIEPDPDRATAVKLHARKRYRYPGKDFSNTEASFWYRGQLVLATKSSPTRLYRFTSFDGPGPHTPQYVGALHGAPRISVLRPAPDHSALVASNHETVSVFSGNGRASRLEDFVGKGPSYSKKVFDGDNVEAGDYFPTGSCDLVMLSESRAVYRILR